MATSTIPIPVPEAVARAYATSATQTQLGIAQFGQEMISSLVLHPDSRESNQTLYAKDVYAWSQTTADLIRAGKWYALDPAALAEEVESVGASERNAVSSAVYQILVHLLKWQYQPTRQSTSWRLSLLEHRHRIARRLQHAPSLERHIGEMIQAEYPRACRKASIQTHVPRETFPEICPWNEAQIRDPDFLPDA